MSYTVVCLDIHYVKSLVENDPVYRVFLDDQLVIERRFWPNSEEFYIQEQLTITDDENEHSIYAKNVFPDRGRIKIKKVSFFDGDSKKPLNLNCDFRDNKYFFKTSNIFLKHQFDK